MTVNLSDLSVSDVYFIVDRNRSFRFFDLDSAKDFAKELSRECGYYPVIEICGIVQ